MKIDEAEKLLRQFSELPKHIREPTYLEICRYPNSRFEEICSRILSFFLRPSNKHGFNDLFLSSLLNLCNGVNITYENKDVNVITEENADGKRLDILVFSNNNFVIGIENKIKAKLYNPLDKYKERIEQYSKSNIFKIVLTLYPINDKDEIKLMNNNGFINITYKEYIEKIKEQIGMYLNHGNVKYLTFIYDFIQTIENLEGNIMDKKLMDFFYKNEDQIYELTELYEEFSNIRANLQSQKIYELKELICKKTKDEFWWVYKNTDLGYNKFGHKIGIESEFEEVDRNPLGAFNIRITTWKLNDWKPYENIIIKEFPDKELDKSDNRANLCVEWLENPTDEIIIDKLLFYYNYLKGLK